MVILFSDRMSTMAYQNFNIKDALACSLVVHNNTLPFSEIHNSQCQFLEKKEICSDLVIEKKKRFPDGEANPGHGGESAGS